MSKSKRIVIVGGVAGGASAAARARRLSEDAEITIFERGRNISFANCGLPYHIGGAIKERSRLLVQTPEGMKRRYRIDVRTRSEVVSIDRQAGEVVVNNLETGESYNKEYDALILSPGAEPVRPAVPGIDHARVMTLRSIRDMDRIKDVVDSEKQSKAVVVGGGYIGLEMTEALRERGIGVTLVELASQVFTSADPEMVAPIHQELERHGIDLRLKTCLTSIESAGERLKAVLDSGDSIDCSLIIMAVGVRPESKLAEAAGLEIGPTGGIAVDDHMRTSDPDIFAIGDAVEVTHFVDGRKALIPLAGPANRQGRIAADNALGRDSVYGNTQGTAICKVFDLAIAMTGLNEKQLARSSTKYEKIYVHPASNAGYYPGAAQISLKLLFDPGSGRILGAQAVGAEGVDKRIDILATAIRAGMTVQQLSELELCYAPPYSSAKDPVNYAGFVASNVINGDVGICHFDEVTDPAENQMVLDVRTAVEVAAGTIPGSKNIPLDQLRERLDEVPREKELLVICAVGLRGYLACRILTQNGFRCLNLSGGYKTYKSAILTNKNKEVRK